MGIKKIEQLLKKHPENDIFQKILKALPGFDDRELRILGNLLTKGATLKNVKMVVNNLELALNNFAKLPLDMKKFELKILEQQSRKKTNPDDILKELDQNA